MKASGFAAIERPALGLALLVAAVVTAVSTRPAAAQPIVSLPTYFVDDTLVMGLEEPIGMAFLPDGRLLVTEKGTGHTSGKIRMIVGDHIAATDPAGVIDSLVANDERGLQAIAIDPRWPLYPYVYVGYTRFGDVMWLVRLTASGQIDDPNGENLTLGSPLVMLNDLRDTFENHNGLCLRFDPAGYLYFSVGDDSDRCSSQNLSLLRGKLLRMDVTRLPATYTGRVPRALLIPPDNPFVGADSNACLIYAWGLRNPWRFDIDPQTGTIVLADVGENLYEELNEILPGKNYGWPFREGPSIQTPAGCSEPGGPGGSGYEPPILTWVNGDLSVAIRTCAFYRPPAGATHPWPAMYHGDLIYGDYYTSRLRRLRKYGGSWSAPPPAPGQPNADDWAVPLYWNADFSIGPDGSLYWLKAWDNSYNPSSGMLRRIRYTGPPVGVEDPPRRRTLEASPNPFDASTAILFRASTGGAASAAVYDASGRRVRDLSTHAATSDVRIAWDGLDDGGRPVPPGLYLVRVAAAGAIETLRLLRLR